MVSSYLPTGQGVFIGYLTPTILNHRWRMLRTRRWLAAACAAEILPTRFLCVATSNPFLTLYPAAPLTAPAAMALAAALPRGTRKGKIPPRCQRRLRRLLRLGRTMMPMERDRERTLFL